MRPNIKTLKCIKDRSILTDGGCWIWYGHFGKRHMNTTYLGVRQGVHRIAYILGHGEIPKGLHVCHRCDVPTCVNPDHLFVGTNADNTRDRNSKGRNPNALKTHCPRGHEYTKENTFYQKDKLSRKCRVCDRKRTAAYRARVQSRRSRSAQSHQVDY